jgi:hypothetical protein
MKAVCPRDLVVYSLGSIAVQYYMDTGRPMKRGLFNDGYAFLRKNNINVCLYEYETHNTNLRWSPISTLVSMLVLNRYS